MEGLATGTLILTDRGLTPVETLTAGDIIVRPDGTLAPVTRVGHSPAKTVALHGQGHTGFECTPGITFTDMEDGKPHAAADMRDRRWTIGMPRMDKNPEPCVTENEAWVLGWMAGSDFTVNDGFYLLDSQQPDDAAISRFRAAGITEHYPGCWGTEQDVNRIWDEYHPLDEDSDKDGETLDTYTDVLALMELPDSHRRNLLDGYAHSPNGEIGTANVWRSRSRNHADAVALCMLSARTGNTVSILPTKPGHLPREIHSSVAWNSTIGRHAFHGIVYSVEPINENKETYWFITGPVTECVADGISVRVN